MNARRLSLALTKAWGIGALAVLGSCALTSKAELVEPRYFSPERLQQPAPARPTTPVGPIAVRLGRVASGAELRERIAHRDTEFELGYYEDLRWNERPEVFVRRAISRALFERHGLPHAQMGSAVTLEVELIAFEELRLASLHAARIGLRTLIYQNERVISEETIAKERALPKNAPIEDVVAAMATVLDDASETIASEVDARVRALAPEVRPMDAAVPLDASIVAP